jgi:hypothetical protein
MPLSFLSDSIVLAVLYELFKRKPMGTTWRAASFRKVSLPFDSKRSLLSDLFSYTEQWESHETRCGQMIRIFPKK